MPRLVVAYPGIIGSPEPDHLVLDEKLRTGVDAYRARWPGGDVALAAVVERSGPSGAAHIPTVSASQLGFEVVSAPTWEAAVRAAKGDLVLAPLVQRFAEIQGCVDRVVLVAEFDPAELRRYELASAPRGVAAARIALGSRCRAWRFERWARGAAGVQCNGYPAWTRFKDLNRHSLLFFDTRLTADHVAAARSVERPGPGSPARLCFSGRMIEAKGPQYAVEIATRLERSGTDVELTLLGTGPMDNELRHRAGPHMQFRGSLPFADEWTRFVREEVDLMVLPHVQGDPSGTYLEAAGCGVPVVGFDNVALSELSRREGIGRTARMRDVDDLERVVRDSLADRAGWEAERARGLEFMSEHHVDAAFDQRVEHLISVV